MSIHMRMKNIQYAHLLSCLIAASFLALPSITFADCNELNSNAAWNKGLSLLQKQVEGAKFSEALETSKPLFAICQNSPSLLYFTGLAMRGTGDEERARIYFQKASESLSIMAAEPGLSRQIWYMRYEAEHPESSPDAIKEVHQTIDEQNQTIETLKQQVIDLTDDKHRLELSSVALSASSDEEARHYRQVLWTGVGIGIGGLALAATGTALAVTSDAAEVKKTKLSENKLHTAGWILLGSGIGLTAAGIVMAAIGGYHYSTTKDDAIISLQVSPVGASFGMTF